MNVKRKLLLVPLVAAVALVVLLPLYSFVLRQRQEEARRVPVLIILTFDDGPHASAEGLNYTNLILSALRNNPVRPGIVAAFFVQTCVPYRMANPNGEKMVRFEHSEGHLIGLHTGSYEDHVDHVLRANAVAENIPGVTFQAKNGLESDLVRGKQRIKAITGSEPLFVRPVGLHTTHVVRKSYAALGLTSIQTDVDSFDSTSSYKSKNRVLLHLYDDVRACLSLHHNAQKPSKPPLSLTILMHDPNHNTAVNIVDYIQMIDDAVRDEGFSAHYPINARQIEAAFISRKGVWRISHDEP